MEILYEDKDIIVINKPAGIATQTKKVGEKDIVSDLKKYFKGAYVGVVHRLDQPVSGLLVFAKNKQSASALSREVASKGDAGFSKNYTAICLPDGDYVKKATLENRLVKLKEGLARIVKPDEEKDYPDAKSAVLSYEVSGEYKSVTGDKLLCVKVSLMTGRFHQIRVQLAGADLPIVGDLKYGSEKSKEAAAKLGIKRVLLCADRLSFKHPVSGKNLEFTCDAFRDIIEHSCLAGE
ncbi:MAG: RluA family pseudouridine synthase [Lachnospiraceae bacterium]|nr:RluA family pseudouridine synthase [Lachnospiraceae bacterium]